MFYFHFRSISISYFFSLFLSNFAISRLIVMGFFSPELLAELYFNNFWMFLLNSVLFCTFHFIFDLKQWTHIYCMLIFFRDIVTTILLEIQLKWWKIKSNENKSGKIILMVHKIKNHCPWVMVEITKISLFTLLYFYMLAWLTFTNIYTMLCYIQLYK